MHFCGIVKRSWELKEDEGHLRLGMMEAVYCPYSSTQSDTMPKEKQNSSEETRSATFAVPSATI